MSFSSKHQVERGGTLERYANMSVGNWRSHFLSSSDTDGLSIFSSVCLKRSIRPSDWEWYGAVRVFFYFFLCSVESTLS